MKKIVAIMALAGVAGLANAQFGTGLVGQGRVSWEFSTDGGGTWGTNVNVLPGGTVLVRGSASWQADAGVTVHGFSTAAFEQINFTGSNATDDFSAAITNANRRVAFASTAAWSGQANGAEWKIDTTSNPATGRVQFGQAAAVDPLGNPNPNYSAANPISIFNWSFVAGTGFGRTITINGQWTRLSSPSNAGNQFVVFTNDIGSNSKFRTDAAQDTATVTIVPAPASLALIGLGGLVAGRRRR